jgi:hypothetical protein
MSAIAPSLQDGKIRTSDMDERLAQDLVAIRRLYIVVVIRCRAGWQGRM